MDWCFMSARMMDGEKAPWCGVEGNLVHSACSRTVPGWVSMEPWAAHPSNTQQGCECCVNSGAGAGLGHRGPGKPQRAKAFKGHAMLVTGCCVPDRISLERSQQQSGKSFSNPPPKGIVSFLPASSRLASCYEVRNPARAYNLM